MKLITGIVSISAGAAFATTAQVSNVTVSQSDRMVTIGYALSADAIVTCSMETNAGSGVWVAIPESGFTSVFGDVNRAVAHGEGKSIKWYPAHDWPNHGLASADIRAKLTAWDPVDPPDYMVVDLAATNTVSYYTSTNAFPGGIGDRSYRVDKLVMRHIRAAGQTFRMGSPLTETARGSCVLNYDEAPHPVSFTHDYWMGVFEFTFGQLLCVTNMSAASYFHKDSSDVYRLCPLENMAYVNFHGNSADVADGTALKALRNVSGIAFGLPTEAEWEFAARAGVENGLPNGKEIYNNDKSPDSTGAIGWTRSNSGAVTHPVGLKEPNNWGLYDVIGNVKEGCRDVSAKEIGTDYAVDPTGPAFTVNAARIMRGGECRWMEYNDRLAARTAAAWFDARGDYGYRVWAPCPIK